MKAILMLATVCLPMLIGAFPLGVSADSFHTPKKYYLALGDSAAFGFQLEKFDDEVKATGTEDPTTFNTGYVDDFAARLAVIDPGIQTVNMSCPGYGGSSTGFLDYCRFYVLNGFALHYNYTGSQLNAAITFLQAHPGQVSPVTIGIGLGDLEPFYAGCKFKSACIFAGLPAVLETFKTNFTKILTELRAAAPDSEILVMQNYNPDALKHPFTNDVILALNHVIGDVARLVDARLVDMYPVFNGTLLGPQPVTLCALLAVCAPPLFDIHPTDYGYEVMAEVFWAASGYEEFNSRADEDASR